MITARVEGAAQLAAGLNGAASELSGNVRQAMQASLLLIEGDARRNLAPGHGRDTGRLQGSITHRISGSGASLTGEVGPSVGYGLFVHEGRAAGRQPPIAAVEGWARRHGISPFLVARAIGRRGIRSNPFLVPAFERNRSKIEQLFSAIGARVVSRIGGR